MKVKLSKFWYGDSCKMHFSFFLNFRILLGVLKKSWLQRYIQLSFMCVWCYSGILLVNFGQIHSLFCFFYSLWTGKCLCGDIQEICNTIQNRQVTGTVLLSHCSGNTITVLVLHHVSVFYCQLRTGKCFWSKFFQISLRGKGLSPVGG